MNSPTKEQLKELMGYLGQTLSVPQVVQNFQPSDTYLLGERMIGRWVNGKPIYRYVLDCSEHEINLVRQSTATGRIDGILQDNNNTKRVDNFLDHPEQLINAHCWTRYGGDDTARYRGMCVSFKCELDTNDNTLAFSAPFYWNPSQVDYLQIDYTKTTDDSTAYKLGSPYDYSLDETIIGTWIDGSPVYQRVIYVDSITLNGRTTPQYYMLNNIIDFTGCRMIESRVLHISYDRNLDRDIGLWAEPKTCVTLSSIFQDATGQLGIRTSAELNNVYFYGLVRYIKD